MEQVENVGETSDKQSQSAVNEVNSDQQLSDNGIKLVNLIIKIIVNATLRECYEEGDKVSEI